MCMYAGLFWIDPNYGSMADAFEVKCIEDHNGIGTCIKPATAQLVSCQHYILVRVCRCSCTIYCNQMKVKALVASL